MTDIEEKMSYVARHSHATCDRFERRFRALGHEWDVSYEDAAFTVRNMEENIGRVTAEEIVREEIDSIVARMVTQDEPLPFQNGPEDEEYPSAE